MTMQLFATHRLLAICTLWMAALGEPAAATAYAKGEVIKSVKVGAFAGEQIYLFHCHNLEHEDAGMMLRVRVG